MPVKCTVARAFCSGGNFFIEKTAIIIIIHNTHTPQLTNHMSIHMTHFQSQIFWSQKLKIFASPFLRSETKSIFWVWHGPFFAIIQAVMDEIKNFLREQLCINGDSDIYDAKVEMCWINIKCSVALKRILKLNICVIPNWINCPN